MVRSFSYPQGPGHLQSHLDSAGCFIIAFSSKSIYFYTLISSSTHIHSSVCIQIFPQLVGSNILRCCLIPQLKKKKEIMILWFLLNMEWNADMNSVIIFSLEMPFASPLSPVSDKLCHNRKIPVKFSKELYAASRPWNYNYALRNYNRKTIPCQLWVPIYIRKR